MPEAAQKPLNWKPTPGIGYTVTRRADGGMHYVFTDVTPATLDHWHAFAIQHLYDSDRLTRNLYDLRRVPHITEQAMNYAIEINSDPAARNVRVAVLVANKEVQKSILAVHDLTTPGGVEMGVFTEPAEAEPWLNRPLTTLV